MNIVHVHLLLMWEISIKRSQLIVQLLLKFSCKCCKYMKLVLLGFIGQLQAIMVTLTNLKVKEIVDCKTS